MRPIRLVALLGVMAGVFVAVACSGGDPALGTGTAASEGRDEAPASEFGSPEREAGLLITRAMQLQADRQYEPTVRMLTEAIRLDPENPNAYYFRANAHRAAGRLAEAVEDYSRVVELDPTYLEA
ncbi:MAG: tetratricopeptide repeat protein, partial [Dehalococcoidia bacterium]|nr:tetratricopeptide repeat protein [Dehalococcoidia bacterium]